LLGGQQKLVLVGAKFFVFFADDRHMLGDVEMIGHKKGESSGQKKRQLPREEALP
jgi:hypothetical protein